MEISNVKISNTTNFSSRKLFATTLYKKAANGVQKPVRAFISELTAQDLGRADLKPSRWGRTLFGKDILEDFNSWYSPHLFENFSSIPPYSGEQRFFAVETAGKRGNEVVALAKARVLDDFIVLDRLQTLVKTKKAKNRVNGAGSGILYAVTSLADKMKKKLVSLEAHEKANGFYKKAGLNLEERGMLSFYRLYQPQYQEFLEKMGKKIGIIPVK